MTLARDDSLTNPFHVDELLARVRAVLRRAHFSPHELSHSLSTAPTTTTIGALTRAYSQRLVTMQGKEIALTPIEYRILSYVAHHVGRIITQDVLLEHVWGVEYVGEGHMLHVNANRLRHKIEPDPVHPRYVLTKVGVGSLLAAQPDQENAEP